MGLFKLIGGWLGGVYAAPGPGGPIAPGPAFHPHGRTFIVAVEPTRPMGVGGSY